MDDYSKNTFELNRAYFERGDGKDNVTLREKFPDKPYLMPTEGVASNDKLFLEQLISNFGSEEPISFQDIKGVLEWTNTPNEFVASGRLRRLWRRQLIRRFVQGNWNNMNVTGRWWGVHYMFSPPIKDNE